MRKSLAKKHFKEIYDSTFDDAVTYVFGKTGQPNILSDVLFNTYAELFMFLKKLKKYDDNQVSDFFYTCLNDVMSDLIVPETESPREIAPASTEQVNDILQTEFDLNDEQAIENMLTKKVYSFILKKSAIERKIFVLYFYKGFDVRRISGLLGVDTDIVLGCVYTLLSEIKNNFLASYTK